MYNLIFKIIIRNFESISIELAACEKYTFRIILWKYQLGH